MEERQGRRRMYVGRGRGRVGRSGKRKEAGEVEGKVTRN